MLGPETRRWRVVLDIFAKFKNHHQVGHFSLNHFEIFRIYHHEVSLPHVHTMSSCVIHKSVKKKKRSLDILWFFLFRFSLLRGLLKILMATDGMISWRVKRFSDLIVLFFVCSVTFRHKSFVLFVVFICVCFISLFNR